LTGALSVSRDAVTRTELVYHAARRLREMAPRQLVALELLDRHADRDDIPAILEDGRELDHRELDDDGINELRVAALAAASQRLKLVRKRLGELKAELDTAEAIEPGETVSAQARLGMILAIHRAIQAYLVLDHRTYRDLIVALVPREARQDKRAPTAAEIRAMLLESLN
jgi:serine phosphatase RsbU (regulator of sigma subunit)